MASLNPRKVIFNPFKDSFGFAWTELNRKPFNGISIRFVVVAAVNAVTQWNDVRRNSTGTIRRCKRYPMISGYRMPQSRLTTAHSAATIEVIEGTLPIGNGKSIGELLFSRFAPLFANSILFGMIAQVFFAVKSSIWPHSIFVFGNIQRRFIFVLMPISSLIECFLRFVFLVVAFFAFFTNANVTIFTLRVFVKSIQGFPRTTFAACFTQRNRLINHLRFSFAGFACCCGQAAKQAVRAVHEAALVHNAIIPSNIREVSI